MEPVFARTPGEGTQVVPDCDRGTADHYLSCADVPAFSGQGALRLYGGQHAGTDVSPVSADWAQMNTELKDGAFLVSYVRLLIDKEQL